MRGERPKYVEATMLGMPDVRQDVALGNSHSSVAVNREVTDKKPTDGGLMDPDRLTPNPGENFDAARKRIAKVRARAAGQEAACSETVALSDNPEKSLPEWLRVIAKHPTTNPGIDPREAENW